MPRLLLVLTIVSALLAGATSAGAATPRIVGGQPSDIAAWPYLAAIVQRGEPNGFDAQYCGGALIAPRAVLTAAHCLDTRPMEVLMGRTTLSGDGGERIPVIEKRLPPNYDAANNNPDLAVLVLERDATAAPIALAGPADAVLESPGTPFSVAGWGLTSQKPREISADTLEAGTLQALAASACRSAFGTDFTARSMLCAATPGTGRPDTCQGDSGGPVVANAPGSGALRLVAVVSWGGQKCGDPETPGVYARVIPQSGWLQSEIARSGAAAAPPVAPALPAESVKSIRLRFGRMACESTTRCFVDIKTTGPVERLGGGLALRVRRGGRNPVDRFVMAQRVRKGLWRAWTNLPWGTVRLTAMGADAEGNVVTRPVRQTITVEAG